MEVFKTLEFWLITGWLLNALLAGNLYVEHRLKKHWEDLATKYIIQDIDTTAERQNALEAQHNKLHF